MREWTWRHSLNRDSDIMKVSVWLVQVDWALFLFHVCLFLSSLFYVTYYQHRIPEQGNALTGVCRVNILWRLMNDYFVDYHRFLVSVCFVITSGPIWFGSKLWIVSNTNFIWVRFRFHLAVKWSSDQSPNAWTLATWSFQSLNVGRCSLSRIQHVT